MKKRKMITKLEKKNEDATLFRKIIINLRKNESITEKMSKIRRILVNLRGSLIGQMEKLAAWNSNNNKYGITVKQILSEGFSKLDNPYLQSHASKEQFLKTNRQLLSYIKNTFPEVKALWHIKPEHIQSYVENWMVEHGFSKQTFKQQSAQIGKLEKMIKYTLGCKGVNFGEQKLYSGRWLANEIAKNLPENSYAPYKDMDSLISNLSEVNDKIFATAQVEGGFRFTELQNISIKNLKGMTADEITGEERGIIHVQGRFGRDCFVSQKIYQKIEDVIKKEGKFSVKWNRHGGGYFSNLSKAAKTTKQIYQGSLGFRYNFVQRRYNEYLEALLKKEPEVTEVDATAKESIAKEMGNISPITVECYLGR